MTLISFVHFQGGIPLVTIIKNNGESGQWVHSTSRSTPETGTRAFWAKQGQQARFPDV